MALVHAGLGERDLAFEWLDRAFDAHDVHLIFLTVNPKWESIPRRFPVRSAAGALWFPWPVEAGVVKHIPGGGIGLVGLALVAAVACGRDAAPDTGAAEQPAATPSPPASLEMGGAK